MSSTTNRHIPSMPVSASLYCNILELPRELRDTIFEYALVSGYHQGEVWIETPSGDISYLPPPLLATCRQIKAEASETYFKKTTFLFEDVSNCKRWLRSLEPTEMNHIRHLGYCDAYPEDDTSSAVDHSAELILREIQAYFDAAGIKIKRALRVCAGCTYPYGHRWIGWTDDGAIARV